MELSLSQLKLKTCLPILNLRWVFVVFSYIALAIALFTAFPWLARIAGATQGDSFFFTSFSLGHGKVPNDSVHGAEEGGQTQNSTAYFGSASAEHQSKLSAGPANLDGFEAKHSNEAPSPSPIHGFAAPTPLIAKAGEQVKVQVQVDGAEVSTVNNTNGGNGSTPQRKSGKCDLSKGRWVQNTKKPLYTNNSCPYIQPDQNCLTNGHPATKTLFWRWKPDDCSLARFDAKKFLHLANGKVWAYVGDSIARNQMQSLLCMLSQVEKPKNTYSDRKKVNVHWHFPSHNFTLMVLWSPYLVSWTEEPLHGLPKGMLKLRLDVVDPHWLTSLPSMDVVILSTGHWILKAAAYISKDEVVGCHSCGRSHFKNQTFFFGYQHILRSALQGIKATPEFHGTVFLRTYSVDHFENGDWNTGGTCNRTEPSEAKIKFSKYKESINSGMYKIGIDEFRSATEEKSPNSCKIRLLDVTYMSLLRPDGHPGKFRDKAYQLALKAGKLVPNDCLHWCLPGPIDAWNELVFQMMQQQQQQDDSL